MQAIEVETKIAAPRERCFLLSLSIDLHVASTAPTRERAIAGTTHGLIGLGETVTWRGKHFGLTLTHKTLITKYNRPGHFQDIMVEGAFRSFEHDHYFKSLDNETLMRDELRFAAPLGPLGLLAESLLLRRYLERFLIERNKTLKRIAESPEAYRRYLDQKTTLHPADHGHRL
jgi:ligand-binding SRPBCC domain-containing protein